MGLADRHYMREASSRFQWSVTNALVAVLVVAYVLQRTLLPFAFGSKYLMLSLDGLRHGFVWQLLTYQFMHSGWLHLIFNALTIYFMGRSAEVVFGRTRWLILYFTSGVIGGLFQMLFAWVLPAYFDTPVVGASAGASGLLAAFALIHWEEQFLLLIYFVPATLRGKTLFWATLVLTVVGIAASIIVPLAGGPVAGSIAHAAHLGGLLTGFALARLNPNFNQLFRGWNLFQSRQRKRELVKPASIKVPRWPGFKSENPADLPSEEFISREVDPILDKISAHGIQSLTDRERRILEAARSKMAKR